MRRWLLGHLGIFTASEGSDLIWTLEECYTFLDLASGQPREQQFKALQPWLHFRWNFPPGQERFPQTTYSIVWISLEEPAVLCSLTIVEAAHFSSRDAAPSL